MRTTRRFAQSLAVTCALLAFSNWAFGQKDPGVRGGIQNTGGGLQQQGIPIPHPPLITPNPATGATVNDYELASFLEGILRAGQLESTCDDCADVTDGSPVIGLGELDPMFPQFHTNSNGLGARHNADQCFSCHGQPTLGGSVLSAKCDSSTNPTAPPMAEYTNYGPYEEVRTIPRFRTAL